MDAGKRGNRPDLQHPSFFLHLPPPIRPAGVSSMVSAVFVIHWADVDLEYLRCELLLHRCFFDNIPDPHLLISRFYHLYRSLHAQDRTPVLYDRGFSYIYLWGENDVMVMAVATSNVNVLLVVTFLHNVHGILVRYFEKPHTKIESDGQAVDEDETGLTRERVIDNYPLVFEILDECMDNGIVQITDYNILKEYIKTDFNRPAPGATIAGNDDDSDNDSDSSTDGTSRESSESILSAPFKRKRAKSRASRGKVAHSTKNMADKSDVLAEQNNNLINNAILRTQASSISWRPKGIFYPKNEIYIDIEETSEFLYDFHTNTVKFNEISGVCEVKSYLSGMPRCKLGLNEKYISKVDNEDEQEKNNTKLDEEEEEEEEEDISSRPGNLLNDDTNSIHSGEDESVSSSGSKPTKRLKVPILNAQFHQCIDLSPVYRDNLIQFTPPDDQFTLLSYNVEQQRRKDKKPLLMVHPVYRIVSQEGKLQVMCSLNVELKKRLHCKALVVRLPINPRLFLLNNKCEEKLRFKAEAGEVQFRVDSSELVWGIPNLAGSQRSVRMMAELAIDNSDKISALAVEAVLFRKLDVPLTWLAPTTSDSGRAADELNRYYGVNGARSAVFGDLQDQLRETAYDNDISLDFDIPMLAYSGLRITYLTVEEETLKYTCFPWVRYLTKARSAPGGRNARSRSHNKMSGYRFRLAPRCFHIQ